MSETKPKPFLTLELRCGCGASLFAELPQDPGFSSICNDFIKLGTEWTKAHAAHHQEPSTRKGVV